MAYITVGLAAPKWIALGILHCASGHKQPRCDTSIEDRPWSILASMLGMAPRLHFSTSRLPVQSALRFRCEVGPRLDLANASPRDSHQPGMDIAHYAFDNFHYLIVRKILIFKSIPRWEMVLLRILLTIADAFGRT